MQVIDNVLVFKLGGRFMGISLLSFITNISYKYYSVFRYSFKIFYKFISTLIFIMEN